ncbi:MAG: D-sedoheptulose 7-phosphate isomerase [Pirellulales bacterium]|nr:D-sedoheptulose 7-phosphate isomerase [Pirellulales bacterium]
MSETDADADWLQKVQGHFQRSADVKREFAAESGELLVRCADRIAASFQQGGKLMFCGNGGSAADCQHLATEFVSVLTQEFDRPALPALALTTDTSFLTARSNDYGFRSSFSRQVEALGKPGDVLIGISTSGNSENVLQAFQAARSREIFTIGFTGRSGGKMGDGADLLLRVPSESTQHIQECHIAMGHVMVAQIEQTIFSKGKQE